MFHLFLLILFPFYLLFSDQERPTAQSSQFYYSPSWGADSRLKTLYSRLDPSSISQHLAFYQLYSLDPSGQEALRHAWILLNGSSAAKAPSLSSLSLSPSLIDALVSIVNKPIDQEIALSDENAIEALVKLSSRLQHYRLKGHHLWNEEEVLSLPPEEIDLARGLFLSQFGTDRRKIQSYEALIDLMSLQISARLSKNSSPQEKIAVINSFIFEEMGFRFPPHSLYAKDIDLYTFLPSVLDSRRGVCLGVSILYLCIAQRLGLSLEMITPPGHIYVRYRDDKQLINIETTARGIHRDSKDYLGINTCKLEQRTLKEVIGMAHFNQASVYWQNEEHEKALKAYLKAQPYMENDPLLKEFMGYLLLLTNSQEEGEQLLKEVKDIQTDYQVVKSTIAEDYFNGKIDAKGISVLFAKVDEDRKSILAKKELLEETLKKYPQFRAGLLSLAVSWIQLHRLGEALDTLKRFLAVDKNDPEVHYYLSVIYALRSDYPYAWQHLQQAEKIVKAHQHDPRALKELRRELLTCAPE